MEDAKKERKEAADNDHETNHVHSEPTPDPSINSKHPCDELPPQLTHLGITQNDLSICIKVLDAVATLDPKYSKKRKADTNTNDNTNNAPSSDGLAAFRHPTLRPLRISLSTILPLHNSLKYNGLTEEAYYSQRLAERDLKRQKMAERAMQKKYVAATDLRRGRVEKLNMLKEEGKEEERKLLECLVPDGHVDTSEGMKLLENGDANNKEASVLPNLRSCYACKIRFRTLHHFYDQVSC
jgi:hypothetical protein